MPTLVNVDGILAPPEQARIGVLDHGLLYGDSIYETLHAWGTRAFRLEQHLTRLERSAELVSLALPGGPKGIAAELTRTLEAAANPESAVRVMVTRGEGPIGLDPGLCPKPTLIVIVRPFTPLPPQAYETGVAVVVARTFRNSPRALDPEIKSGNFLNNILAAREALAQGALEALMLNPEGNLAEATQSNVFLVRGGRLRTPPPRSGLLRGVTRALVLQLARAAEIPTDEEDVFVSEIYDADELFLTSTLKGVVPVARIGERRVGEGVPGPVTRRVMAMYRGEIEGFLAG